VMLSDELESLNWPDQVLPGVRPHYHQ